MTDISHIFASDGTLAETIPGYRTRAQQVEMAQAIADAIDHCRVLVAEAGTGTGKTFAYLVPALLSGGKVIVSTGTKTLQDQLFNRDLPAVRDALKVPVTVAMLKGRANYVCHFHLERAAHEGRFLNREDAGYVHIIRIFANRASPVTRWTLREAGKRTIWAAVNLTREHCIWSGMRLPQGMASLWKAPNQTLATKLGVINHHSVLSRS